MQDQPVDTYQAQRRMAGKGKIAAAVKDEDFVEHILVASTRHYSVLLESRQSILAEGVPDTGRNRTAKRGDRW